MTDKERSYDEICQRIERLVKRGLDVTILGDVTYDQSQFPIYQVNTPVSEGNDNILISGGVHGDEPAGVYASLNFLENHANRYLDRFNFFAYPCINPSGFEMDTIENSGKVNLNRDFKQDYKSQEVAFITESLKQGPKHYLITMDLHEAPPNYEGEGFTKEDNPKEFWLYEVCEDKSIRIGDKIVQGIEEDVPVCKWKTIYDDINSGGVIWYPEGCANEVYAESTTFEGLLDIHYTNQSFTVETPTGWDLRKRVNVHTKTVVLALDEVLKRE